MFTKLKKYYTFGISFLCSFFIACNSSAGSLMVIVCREGVRPKATGEVGNDMMMMMCFGKTILISLFSLSLFGPIYSEATEGMP